MRHQGHRRLHAARRHEAHDDSGACGPDSRRPYSRHVEFQSAHAGLRHQRSKEHFGDGQRRGSSATGCVGGGEVTRGVTTAILIIALALPAFPQCDLSPILSDPFRSSILDLALEGNDLWAATSYGVSLYDRSVDPPRLVALLAIPGTTRLIRLGNGLAYVGSGNSIAVVRKNGRSLQLIRSVDAGAPVNDMVVTTLALYVATGNGITQYSLIDPANPTATSTIFQTSQTSVTSLALIGATLYAADGDS